MNPILLLALFALALGSLGMMFNPTDRGYDTGLYEAQDGKEWIAKGGGPGVSLFRFGQTETDGSTYDPAAWFMGGGNSSHPLGDAAGLELGSNNWMSFYFRSNCADGSKTPRGLYLRHYIAGTGGGEAGRFFTTCEAVVPSEVDGAQISLSFGTSGVASGLGVAVRSTLQLPNRAQAMGSIAAHMAEIWLDGASADPTGSTVCSLHRDIVDDATHSTTYRKVVKTWLDLTCGTAAVSDPTQMFTTGITVATMAALLSCAIQVRINGTLYWIPVATAIH